MKLRMRSIWIVNCGAALCSIVPMMLCTCAVAQSHEPRTVIAEDALSIIEQYCADCHRSDGIAPFPLTSPEDIAKRAKQIAVVIESGYMPPWLPQANPKDSQILGNRRLTAEQIELIRMWVDGGAKPHTSGGQENRAQHSPKQTWPLGEPDLVLTLSQPYTLPAEGNDVVRTFVFPVDLPQDEFVRAIDFRPGHARVVHHASFSMDDTGSARMIDDADDVPGYASMGDIGFNLSGSWGVWSPAPPSPASAARMMMLPENVARRLPNRCDIVVEVHFNLTGKRETIRPQVALYFTKEPVRQMPVPVTLGTSFIDIAAGQKNYSVRDAFVLPVDAQLLSIAPRAHYVCRRMNVKSTFADGRALQLLRIDDWDFNWAQEYRYASPICLPAGTTIEMEFVYDNSAENGRNPSHPPQRVIAGFQPTNEMGLLFLYLIPDERAGHDVLSTVERERMLERLNEAKSRRNKARS